MLPPAPAFLALCPLVFTHAAGAWVTPGAEWETASPESQGRPPDAMGDVAAFVGSHGGGGRVVVTRAPTGAVFDHATRCYRSSVTYDADLGRYRWRQVIPPIGSMRDRGPEHDVRFEPTQDRERLQMSALHGTRVAIVDGKWHINGEITYPGAQAEGLLMNVRMVNSTFEDRNRDDFDSDANTAAFLERIPDYHAEGVRAFTLNLQGGLPGYEGALNSAFEPNGALRASYLQRIRRVVEACDKQGIVVILGCFYQRQDQVLEDDDAIRAAVRNAVRWVQDNRLTNVMLEVANEFDHNGFDHDLIKSVEGQVELIRLAKETAPGMLVSTSGLGHGRMHEPVAEVVDFIMPHYNGTPVNEIPARIEALKPYGKPIVCNEDDKVRRDGAEAARLSVENGASWGFMTTAVNQYQPFEFGGRDDDPAVYDMLRSLTTP